MLLLGEDEMIPIETCSYQNSGKLSVNTDLDPNLEPHTSF